MTTIVTARRALAAAAALFLTGATAAAALPTSLTTLEELVSRAEVREALRSQRQNDLTPWLGCWQRTDDEDGVMMCLVPGAEPGTLRHLLVEDGTLAEERVLRPDGTARPLEQGGCTGTETVSWSADGRRLYFRTVLDCAGVARRTTSLLAFASASELIDAQTVTVAGQRATRTTRYRTVAADAVPAGVAASLPPVGPLVQQSARLHAATPLDEAGLVEATRVVDGPALQALLVARQQPMPLNAQRLVRLERAGVAGEVLDVLVALAHPERYSVAAAAPEPPVARTTAECAYADVWRDDPACDRWAAQQYGYRDRYGYDNRYRFSRYGYDPFGYGYWGYGWDRGWVVQRPVVVIVDGSAAQQSARLTRSGYTPGSGGQTAGRARPRNDGSPTPQPTTSGSGSSNSGVSSSGTGSGSSDTSSGRTAVPRGGGGG